jgi:hypothetical protein
MTGGFCLCERSEAIHLAPNIVFTLYKALIRILPKYNADSLFDNTGIK